MRKFLPTTFSHEVPALLHKEFQISGFVGGFFIAVVGNLAHFLKEKNALSFLSVNILSSTCDL